MSETGTGPTVHIVATGVANTASVCAAFRRLGCATSFVTTPDQIREGEFVVLPGVGAFAAAMARLRSAGEVASLRERVAADRPTLAICLGMQLLGLTSDESPGVEGLGVVPANAGRFEGAVRVPHMGWNRVVADPGCRVLQSGDAYFANSYRWADVPGSFLHDTAMDAPAAPANGASAADWSPANCKAQSWSAGRTHHGGPFLAAVERGTVLACQFHPELSGDYGTSLLRRWLENGGATW